MGHMEPATHPSPDGYYIPHHAVTTKFRVVFNASAKTSTGVSLNDAQHIGPQIQDPLVNILIRFRRYPVAITADVEKMFRQILVDDQHRHWQQILWRDDIDQPVRAYRLNTVTYGMASSPYVAVRTLQQCAMDNKHVVGDDDRAERACNSVLRNFYVDDYLESVDSSDDAIQLADDVDHLLRSGQFHLRKWNSNDGQTVARLSGNQRPAAELAVASDAAVTSVLGIRWDPVQDEIFYQITLDSSIKPATKRTVLSEISRCFDPLGLLSPVMIQARIFVQSLWKEQLEWDTPLPPHLLTQWTTFRSSLPSIETIRIPRWIGCRVGVHMSLHGFCDASMRAYGAVVYVRTRFEDGQVTTRILAAKARVAPVKEMTIPKLELSSAALLCELIQKVRSAYEIPEVECHLWSDSTVALCWITKPLSALKPYVANRVKIIRAHSHPSQWRHIRTAYNPADILSRGVSPTSLKDHHLWWSGPDCLADTDEPPAPPPLSAEEQEITDRELKPVAIRAHLSVVTTTFITTWMPQSKKIIPLVERFSSLQRLLHTTAILLRWLPRNRLHRGRPVSPVEAKYALRVHILQDQRAHFAQELQLLQRGRPAEIKGPLTKLASFIDPDGVLRVGGRLHNSDLPEDAKHPIILSRESKLALLLVENVHKVTLHGGLQLMLQYIRAEYWIIHGRAMVKSSVYRCVTCKKYQRAGNTQQMATLPRNRVRVSTAFNHTGVDYAGPFMVYHGNVRRTVTKCYAAVFVCMSTKAVHIEVAKDLSARAFLDAFDRFSGRRGLCRTLLSDNGTQMVGAARIMRQDLQAWRGVDVQQVIADQGVDWQFITPAAPHHGGLWEAAVKSAKKHLLRVIGKQSLPYDSLQTLLVRIEACLNSRPLTVIYDDPTDGEALTPGHLLIGRPLITRPGTPDPDVPSNRLKHHQLLQRMLAHFWKRWSKEYLVSLQARQKWTSPKENIKVGAVVAVMDDNLPPSSWRTGQVVALHPGSDDLVRTVTLNVVMPGNKTIHQIKRPIQKLCSLFEPSTTVEPREDV